MLLCYLSLWPKVEGSRWICWFDSYTITDLCSVCVCVLSVQQGLINSAHTPSLPKLFNWDFSNCISNMSTTLFRDGTGRISAMNYIRSLQIFPVLLLWTSVVAVQCVYNVKLRLQRGRYYFSSNVQWTSKTWNVVLGTWHYFNKEKVREICNPFRDLRKDEDKFFFNWMPIPKFSELLDILPLGKLKRNRGHQYRQRSVLSKPMLNK